MWAKIPIDDFTGVTMENFLKINENGWNRWKWITKDEKCFNHPIIAAKCGEKDGV